ncbi:hypothetical protein BJX65DRAFT_246941 [Aspergillus insuetus]
MTWYDRLVTCSLQSPSFDRGYALAQQWLRVSPFETIVPLTLRPWKVKFHGYLAFKIRPTRLCTAYSSKLFLEILTVAATGLICPAAYHRLFNTHCQRLRALR